MPLRFTYGGSGEVFPESKRFRALRYARIFLRQLPKPPLSRVYVGRPSRLLFRAGFLFQRQYFYSLWVQYPGACSGLDNGSLSVCGVRLREAAIKRRHVAAVQIPRSLLRGSLRIVRRARCSASFSTPCFCRPFQWGCLAFLFAGVAVLS